MKNGFRHGAWALGVALCLSALACSAGTTDYTYDALGRLIKVEYAANGKTVTITYSYDAAGNRTATTTTG